jgi:non-ribosomal peptide synthetase component F
MCSLIYSDVVNHKDTVVQIARCSFDVHVQDIVGTLTIGATLVMLHPGGIIDFDYLVHIIKEKDITCITTVPTILYNFFTFLKQINYHNSMKYLRSVCSGGM